MNSENDDASDPSEIGPPGVDWLVGQLKRMAPHLDTYGRAYCGDLGRGRDGKGAWPLDSEPVSTLLAYRYRLQQGFFATEVLRPAPTAGSYGLGETLHAHSDRDATPAHLMRRQYGF